MRLIPAALLGLVACALLALGGVFIAPGLLNRAAATPQTFGVSDTPRVLPTVTEASPATEAPAPTEASTDMVFVPAGPFDMGSDNGEPDEKPVHTVTLDAFWIDRTEVTNAMHERCVNGGACQPPNDTGSYSRSSYYGDSQYDDYPVINVDWNQAKTYCEWAGKRLPTEAEWEKAARGTDGRIYPWGDSSPDSSLLNFNNNVRETTAVGSYPDGASPYGALNMAGNVWEWVNDWYSETYYSRSPSENPTGPSSGDYRVLRGGSWSDDKRIVRTAFRIRFSPVLTNYNLGFRCAR